MFFSDKEELLSSFEQAPQDRRRLYIRCLARMATLSWSQCSSDRTYSYVDSVVGLRHRIEEARVGDALKALGSSDPEEQEKSVQFSGDLSELHAAIGDGDVRVSIDVFHCVSAALYLLTAISETGTSQINSLAVAIGSVSKAHELTSARDGVVPDFALALARDIAECANESN